MTQPTQSSDPITQAESLESPDVGTVAIGGNLYRTRRSLAEWLTFCIATIVLTVLVTLIIFDWQVSQARPPAFQVELVESTRVTDQHYYVPFVITNTGGQIARTVQVKADLYLDGVSQESGEQHIDLLSGNEQKRGSFVFSHDPSQGELVLRVASYGLP